MSEPNPTYQPTPGSLAADFDQMGDEILKLFPSPKAPAPALIGDSAALFADVRRKYRAGSPGTLEVVNWFRLSEVLDHAEAALTANERMREEILQGDACCEQLRHELAAYLTPASPVAEAAGVPAPLTEREREPYLAAIEHGNPRLGDWDYPRMLKRLLAAYDAQAAALENASYMTATAETVALRQQLAAAQARIELADSLATEWAAAEAQQKTEMQAARIADLRKRNELLAESCKQDTREIAALTARVEKAQASIKEQQSELAEQEKEKMLLVLDNKSLNKRLTDSLDSLDFKGISPQPEA